MSEPFWKLAVRLPFFLSFWLLMWSIKLPTRLLGYLVVPFIWKYRNIHYDNLPWWTRPWANPEDHLGGHMHYDQSLPRWWIRKYDNQVTFGMWWRYHAVRNAANGLRSYELLDLTIVPSKVRFYTTEYRERVEPVSLRADGKKLSAYMAWQGWQAGCKIVYVWNDERHLVIKLGWRIEPRDRYKEIDPDGLRYKDAGFASKFLVYRKG